MSDTLRIGGMASGIDTESIIQSLLDAEKAPITELEDEVETESEKYTAWDDLSTQMDSLLDSVDELYDYSLWNQMAASSSDESVATATAGTEASKGSYYIVVSQLAQPHRVGSDSITELYDEGYTPATTTSEALGFSGEFSINGVTVTIESDDTMEDIMDAINTASSDMDDDDAVTASILGGSLVIERSSYGEGAMTFSESGADNSVLRYLGILDGTPGDTGDYSTIDSEHELAVGQNLEATVNGVEVSSTTNTGITDIIDDVTLDFYAEGTATLTVKNDAKSIKSYIEDFVDVYNETWDMLKSLGEAEVSSTSGSLTSLGVLQGDLLISRIQDQLRSIISYDYSDTDLSEYTSLYSVGIWFEDEEGYLEISDEDALDNALNYNIDELEQLFRGYAPSDDIHGGVMRELDDYIYALIDPAEGLVTTKISNLSDDIDEKEDRIDELYSKLSDYEDQLWEHFSWMEDMVSGFNNGYSALTSAIGG